MVHYPIKNPERLPVDILIEAIKENAELYYSGQRPKITDSQFDYLEKIAKGKVPNHSIFKKPGYGYTPTKNKGDHKFGVVGSLEKIREIEKLKAFTKYRPRHQSSSAIGTHKYDGDSVTIEYENGFLKQALSRGDGETGVDITHHIIRRVPRKIPFKDGSVTFRAEGVIRVETFQAKYKGRPYLNPRNTASGILHSLSINPAILDVELVVYQILGFTSEELKKRINTKRDILKVIEECGFIPAITYKGKIDYDELEKWKETSKYPTDGIVFTKPDIVKQQVDGKTIITERSIAFKFKAEQSDASVAEIEWGVGFTGRVTPVAILSSPIFLSGVHVSRVTLHNKKIMVGQGIGVDSIITIERSGEVIPKVVNVIQPTKVKLIKNCPSCEHELTEGDVFLICENPKCPAKVHYKIFRFIDNIAPTEGFGESTLRHLVDALNLQSLPHLINIIAGERSCKRAFARVKNHFRQASGIGDRATEISIEILTKLHESCVEKGLFTDKFLVAIGLPSIAEGNAKKLATIDLKETVKEYGIAGVIKKGIELEAPKPVIESLEENSEFLFDCLKPIKVYPKKVKVVKLDGLKIVVTKALDYGSRDKFGELLESIDMTLSKGISKTTDYLVTNFPEDASGKIGKANKLNIPVISEKEFFDKFINN